MAELATIARPYAEALFQATRGNATATQEWLDPLAVACQTADLLAFAQNPKTTSLQVREVLGSVLPAPLPPQGGNFLNTVIENGRVASLPEIARQYRALVHSAKGAADARIQTAFPLDAESLSHLLNVLQKRFGQTLIPIVEVVPELIGGVRVAVNDEVLDASVKARLAHMRSSLVA